MKKLSVLVLACCFCVSSVLADEIGECYKKAENKVQIMACLKAEYKAAKLAYDDVLDRVMSEARGIDRIQKKKGAVKLLTEANKSFDAYVKDECAYVEVGSQNEQSSLACQINMMRLRAGDLERRYLLEK